MQTSVVGFEAFCEILYFDASRLKSLYQSFAAVEVRCCCAAARYGVGQCAENVVVAVRKRVEGLDYVFLYVAYVGQEFAFGFEVGLLAGLQLCLLQLFELELPQLRSLAVAVEHVAGL